MRSLVLNLTWAILTDAAFILTLRESWRQLLLLEELKGMF